MSRTEGIKIARKTPPVEGLLKFRRNSPSTYGSSSAPNSCASWTPVTHSMSMMTYRGIPQVPLQGPTPPNMPQDSVSAMNMPPPRYFNQSYPYGNGYNMAATASYQHNPSEVPYPAAAITLPLGFPTPPQSSTSQNSHSAMSTPPPNGSPPDMFVPNMYNSSTSYFPHSVSVRSENSALPASFPPADASVLDNSQLAQSYLSSTTCAPPHGDSTPVYTCPPFPNCNGGYSYSNGSSDYNPMPMQSSTQYGYVPYQVPSTMYAASYGAPGYNNQRGYTAVSSTSGNTYYNFMPYPGYTADLTVPTPSCTDKSNTTIDDTLPSKKKHVLNPLAKEFIPRDRQCAQMEKPWYDRAASTPNLEMGTDTNLGYNLYSVSEYAPTENSQVPQNVDLNGLPRNHENDYGLRKSSVAPRQIQRSVTSNVDSALTREKRNIIIG